jgi:hypothetical protein
MPVILGRRVGWKSVLVLAFLGAYVFRFIQFNAFAPEVKFNMMEEANARVREFSPDQCAWPVIKELREAGLLAPPYDQGLWNAWPPSDPAAAYWVEATAFVNQHPETITRLREAALRPHLGFILTSESGDPNPIWTDIRSDNLGSLRTAARYLKFHMALSASQADPAAVVANYVACLRLADHAQEFPTLVAQLVTVAISALAFNEIRDVLVRHPGLFSDAQLAELIVATKTAGGGRYRMRTDNDRRSIEDFLQRLFTDDGTGDGHLCYEGAQFAQRAQIGSNKAQPDPVLRFVRPITSLGEFSRKQIWGWFTHMYDLLDADLAVEPWTLATLHHEVYVSTLPSRGFAKTVHIMSPALSKAFGSFVAIEQERRGVLAALAIHRFRVAHARYPQTLEELVPDYLNDVPIDLQSGQPLRFVHRDGQPYVYSIGSDRDDDGGRVVSDERYYYKAALWFPKEHPFPPPDSDHALYPLPKAENPTKP